MQISQSKNFFCFSFQNDSSVSNFIYKITKRFKRGKERERKGCKEEVETECVGPAKMYFPVNFFNHPPKIIIYAFHYL